MDIVYILSISVAAFLLAGTIKGIAGIGLPTASIALMTLALDPRVAIALVLFPMLGSNIWQVWRAGHIRRTARRYGVFSVILVLGVGATAYATREASDRALLAILGVAVLIFVVLQWRQLVPRISARFDTWAQVGFGLFAGIIGGMTAAWAPPMAMYLAAKQVDKDEFVRATGFMISLGSIPLVLVYVQLGFMTGPLAGISAALLIPTLIGFSMGEAIRARLSAEAFRAALLCLFAVLGLNLIRRAIWYV